MGSELTDTIHIVLNAKGDSCVATVKRLTSGHKALEYRQEFIQGQETLQKSLLQEGMTMKDTLVTQNLEAIEMPFVCKYSVSSEVEQVSDKLLVQPFPGAAYRENPLKLPYRAYPVDMVYRNRNTFVATVDIPEGYSYLPGEHNVSVDNALVNIQYRVEDSKGTVKVTGTYEFKKPVYKNTEYYDLKSYMGKIVEKFNEKIVLVKNK
jgi:hypothetical protein